MNRADLAYKIGGSAYVDAMGAEPEDAPPPSRRGTEPPADQPEA